MDSDKNGGDGPLDPVKMLNILTARSTLPDHKLILKVGLRVILLRSSDHFRTQFNGVRYIVKAADTDRLMFESFKGDNEGRVLALPKMLCSPGDSNFLIQVFTKTQFPASVCLAITREKAQEQSFCEAEGLDLSDPAFSHDQLYVVMSGVTHFDKLNVRFPLDVDGQTRNVVYPEVLV